MEPNSREFYKQCAFQKFCNTVLHNEACDAHRELHRHKAREVTFSDLPLDEARQLHTFDEYFKRETAETVFEKAGKKITPKLLLEAIRTLPEEKRKAVLLYYFEGMNDTEIAELFNTSRSTIQYLKMFYSTGANERIFPVSKHYLHHEMDRGAKAAGVKRIRIHDLRHSHISLLIDMGFTALAIADRVGHESIDITYRYAHLFPTRQKEMADKLDFERMGT